MSNQSPSILQYTPGFVVGTVVQDSVTIGGLTVPKQDFGSVNAVSTDFLNTPESGILGKYGLSISIS